MPSNGSRDDRGTEFPIGIIARKGLLFVRTVTQSCGRYLVLMQQYLILAHWSVSMHILPLSLILCVPLQVWVGEREREVGREREGDSLILNVTEFTEVNALSHLIQIIYKIMVSLPLRPVAARRLKIITSTQNAYVSLKCQRRSQCFHSTQAFCLNSNYLKQIRTQDCMLTVVLSCCLTLNVS